MSRPFSRATARFSTPSRSGSLSPVPGPTCSDVAAGWLGRRHRRCRVARLVLLLGGGDPGLFNRGRLDQPLGYVNGQAAAFAVALWPALGAAERAHRRSVAVLGIGVGSLGLSMVVLTQSRGALVALAVSAAVIVVAVPGRLKRVILLAVLLGGLALVWSRLSGVSGSFSDATGVSQDASRAAARAAIGAAVMAALLWAGVVLLEPTVRRGSDTAHERRTRLGAWRLSARCSSQSARFSLGSRDHGGSPHRQFQGTPASRAWIAADLSRRQPLRLLASRPRSIPRMAADGVGAGNFDRLISWIGD